MNKNNDLMTHSVLDSDDDGLMIGNCVRNDMKDE